jgi:hypothetical protein
MSATRLSVLLLGDKVPSEVIEAQARAFMKLDKKDLDETMARFEESEPLYIDPAGDVAVAYEQRERRTRDDKQCG